MVFSELNHLNSDPKTLESLSSRKKKNTRELPLTPEENDSLIKILDEAKAAEKVENFSLAAAKYQEYKEAFLALRAEKKLSDPYANWETYKNGEVILHYEGGQQNWYPHPEGIVIKKGNQFLLNGTELLYQQVFTNSTYKPHPKGFVIQEGNRFLLNGTELLYEGEWDNWDSNFQQGIVIKKGNQFLLNSTELLYEGELDSWHLHAQGVVIKNGFEFFINNKYAFTELCDDYYPHPEGVVTRHGNKFVLNGKQILYEGDYNGCILHPRGVLIKKGNQFLLNGTELLYEGALGSWKLHPCGFIVKEDNDWIFYNESQK